MDGSTPLALDGRTLRLEDIEDVALRRRPVEICAAADGAMREARRCVEGILRAGKTVYGVNTGFGHLAQVRIADDQLTVLQENLIRSHAVGVGDAFDLPTTRAIMLLRASVLCSGHSGMQPQLVQRMTELLNSGIHPWIPQQGSVGASGDLAPLAHIALILLGEGWVHGEDGSPVPAGPVLEDAGLVPLTLGAKDGLALINGTQAMTGLGALVVLRAERLATQADIIGALTVEAKRASHRPFDPRLHALRPHPGQIAAANNLARLLDGGEIATSHAHCDRVQDAYSLRCMPQVHGASRQVFAHVRSVLEIEANAVTDNPTLFPDSGEAVSGGNFHGQPVAMALDYLAMGLSELGAISERRIEQLVNPRLSQLPAFLSPDPGLNSGYMMAQVTAAALASENKGLCHPASIDSIPTSANQEDHVSMGPIAGRKALRVLENVEQILGIEWLVAAQALELQGLLKPSPALQAAHAALRAEVPHLDGDRILHPDLEASAALIKSGAVQTAASDHIGDLN